MAYQKQTFINDETVLTAENLDHIEQGIVNIEEDIANANYVSADLTDGEESGVPATVNADTLGGYTLDDVISKAKPTEAENLALINRANANTVKFTTQTLTDEQKAVARENIGAEKEAGVYTLVHEVTLTEAVNAFTYECNATKLYVEVQVAPTGESSDAICVLEANGIKLVYFQEATRPSANRLLRSKIIVENRMVRTEDEDSIDYDGSPNNLSWGNTRAYVSSKGGYFINEITSLKFWLTASRLFPIGTTFKVYEVK